jgi:hypothetical protein
MWRWAGGLVALAAVAWALWPSAWVSVTIVAVNKQGASAASAVALLGPKWLGIAYYSSAADDPAAAAATTMGAPTLGSSIRFDISGRDLTTSGKPSRMGFSIGMNISPGAGTDIAVGPQTSTPRSVELRDDRLADAAKFLAREYHLGRAGINVRSRCVPPPE